MMNRCLLAAAAAGVLSGKTLAAVSYFIDDGTPEQSLSISPGESLVYLQSFPVQAGGEYINRISCAWGRAGGGFISSTFTATLVLYSDPNGGDPTDATLVLTKDVQMLNAGTNAITNYPVTSTFVSGTMWVGFVYDNTTFDGDVFVGSLDTTSPTLTQRSYFGYKAGQIIPPTCWGYPLTSGCSRKSRRLRPLGTTSFAVGQATPAPGAAGLLALGAVVGLKRRRG